MPWKLRRAALYRQCLRWGCRALASPDHAAVLLGAPIAALSMDDLEAYFWLIFGFDPRRLAAADYRPARAAPD